MPTNNNKPVVTVCKDDGAVQLGPKVSHVWVTVNQPVKVRMTVFHKNSSTRVPGNFGKTGGYFQDVALLADPCNAKKPHTEVLENDAKAIVLKAIADAQKAVNGNSEATA